MNHLVILGAVWPEPNSTAAGIECCKIFTLFKSKAMKLHFYCSASKSSFRLILSQISVKTKAIQLNDSSFDDEIAALNPNVVLFDRFMIEEQYGWRVMENCPI